MKTLLGAEVFTLDGHLFTGFGLIWFNFGNARPFGAVAHRILFNLRLVKSLDGFRVEEGEAGAFDGRPVLGSERTSRECQDSEHGCCAQKHVMNPHVILLSDLYLVLSDVYMSDTIFCPVSDKAN